MYNAELAEIFRFFEERSVVEMIAARERIFRYGRVKMHKSYQECNKELEPQ